MSILEPVREEPRLVTRDMVMVSPRPPVVSDPDNDQRPEPLEPVTSGNGPNPFASFIMSQQQPPASNSLLSQLRGLPGLPGGLLSVMAASNGLGPQSPSNAPSAPTTPTNASQLQVSVVTNTKI